MTKLLLCLFAVLPVFAQSRVFSKITIRPAADVNNERLQLLPNGDLSATAVAVVRLLSYAWDVPINASSRLSPVPDWAVRERFDIEAKPIFPGEMQQLIRELLADRFKLVIHAEDKTMPVYALTVSSGGSKLQTSTATGKDCLSAAAPGCHSFAGGLGHPLNANAVTMDDLVHYIGNWTDLPVVNRTALPGLFTLNTEGWVPMRLPPPPPNATAAANPFAGLPTLFTVLRKLGLDLTRQEATLPIYTIEHLERPAAD